MTAPLQVAPLFPFLHLYIPNPPYERVWWLLCSFVCLDVNTIVIHTVDRWSFHLRERVPCVDIYE